MAYYCKKCGAVVNGKFCSCCGTQATSDLKDFRRELQRRARAFRNEMHRLDPGITAVQASSFAWISAEHETLQGIGLRVDTFPYMSDVAYSRLPLIESRATALYECAMCAAQRILRSPPVDKP